MPPRASRLSPPGFFVTGTDTGIGKTLMACALLHAFAARGLRVAGMKPVAAGATRTLEGLVNEDVAQLRGASSVMAAPQAMNPYCFEAPIAPHLAAQQAGVAIELDVIVAAYRQLSAQSDLVVVEGVGGFGVPLNERETGCDLARYLGLPVILVVGLRLGCLNHALLTAQAVRAAGLRLAGWIANRVDPAMAAADLNVGALRERLDAPLFADVAFSHAPEAARVAALFDLERLIGSAARGQRRSL